MTKIICKILGYIKKDFPIITLHGKYQEYINISMCLLPLP